MGRSGDYGCGHPANREVIFGVTYKALEDAWIAYLQEARE
jgi:hypothetical protein